MGKILSVEKLEYQKHDESRLRYIRRVETRLVEDGMFEYTGLPLKTSDHIFRVVSSIAHNDREVAIVLFMDRLFMPIGYDAWTGGIDFVSIDPRQIFKVASMLNASQIVICHNHPEGDPKPSLMDAMFCLQVSNLCLIMGWKLFDFLVIGSGSYYSFRNEKNPALLDKFPEPEVKL